MAAAQTEAPNAPETASSRRCLGEVVPASDASPASQAQALGKVFALSRCSSVTRCSRCGFCTEVVYRALQAVRWLGGSRVSHGSRPLRAWHGGSRMPEQVAWGWAAGTLEARRQRGRVSARGKIHGPLGRQVGKRRDLSPPGVGGGTGKVRALSRGPGGADPLPTPAAKSGVPGSLYLLRRGQAVTGGLAGPAGGPRSPPRPMSKPRGAAPAAQPSPCPPRLARAKGWPRRRARVMARAAFTLAAGPAAGERG